MIIYRALTPPPRGPPREGRVSRNPVLLVKCVLLLVTPREGRVSRNLWLSVVTEYAAVVTPREGRVSRNLQEVGMLAL